MSFFLFHLKNGDALFIMKIVLLKYNQKEIYYGKME